jgi:hypothetical protein
MVRSVIDASGRLTIGKYRNRLAFDISRSDPSYLQWVLDMFDDMDEEDAEMIGTLLSQAGYVKGRGPKL